jgi:hypothetical protein
MNLLHGVENASDIIDQIMEINGTDIENAKKQAGTPDDAIIAERDTLKAQLKAYEKDGEKYIDPAEFQRLKQFEADTTAKQKRTEVETAVSEMLTKNKVLPGLIKRELKALNIDEVKLDKDGKVTKEYEDAYIAAFKADCPDGFIPVQEGTGVPTNGGNSGINKGPLPEEDLADILASYHK